MFSRGILGTLSWSWFTFTEIFFFKCKFCLISYGINFSAVKYLKGRKIYERSFCGRNFCEVYFLDLRPYSAKFVLQKKKENATSYKNLTENTQKLGRICKNVFRKISFCKQFFPLRYVISKSNMLNVEITIFCKINRRCTNWINIF